MKEQKADHDHNVATVDTILAGSDPMSALPPEQREMVAANLRQAAIASDFMNGLRVCDPSLRVCCAKGCL